MRRVGLPLSIVVLVLGTAPPSLAAAPGHHRSADRYVLGAAVIAVVAVLLLVQLVVRGRRARRRL
jgi:hypothetical protein